MRLTLSLNAETQKLGRKMINKLVGALSGSYAPALICEDVRCTSTGGDVRIDSEYDLRELPVDDTAGLAYWQKQLGAGAVSEDALQACVTGYAIDPLESAISSIARDAQDAQGSTLVLLNDHLMKLLNMQFINLAHGDAGSAITTTPISTTRTRE